MELYLYTCKGNNTDTLVCRKLTYCSQRDYTVFLILNRFISELKSWRQRGKIEIKFPFTLIYYIEVHTNIATAYAELYGLGQYSGRKLIIHLI
jgi:hypothetical protein